MDSQNFMMIPLFEGVLDLTEGTQEVVFKTGKNL